MKVPSLILSTAKECPNNFRCLKNNKPSCKVIDTVGKEVFFIKSKKYHYCPYKMDFGFSQVCNCPVFQYLYNNQNKE